MKLKLYDIITLQFLFLFRLIRIIIMCSEYNNIFSKDILNSLLMMEIVN